MDTTRRQTALSETQPLAEQIATLLRRLRAGGATELRAARGHLWIIGRAPSGMLFQLVHWPPQGYCVTRRPLNDQPVQSLGVFPTWTEAVDRALQA
jgi:hypothetical protein